MRTREIRLALRPDQMPGPDTFELVEVDVGELGEGQVLIENRYLSVDPYMRGRMRETGSYAAPFEVGKAVPGGTIGRVLASRHGGLAEGDHVRSGLGWREHGVTDGGAVQRVDADAAPLPAYLGVLGMPGMTAYVGLLDLGQPVPGETLFVSGAAGAVGSVVGQIAKIVGCRVVGSAGSAAKVAYLDELGFDVAINYREGDLAEAVADACPDGIDIYFDNVGAEHLAVAMSQMRQNGRMVECGMISQYNLAAPEPGPPLWSVVAKRLTIRGFIVSDHNDRRVDFERDMSRWVAEERVRWRETIVDGFEHTPEAFLGLFSGDNIGKMLVRV